MVAHHFLDYEVRDKKYTAKQLLVIANERFNLEISDEVLPWLISDPDANLNRDTITADFASKILLFYVKIAGIENHVLNRLSHN